MIMREFGEEKRGLEDDDSRESTPASKKIKKAGNKVVESLKVSPRFAKYGADKLEQAEC